MASKTDTQDEAETRAPVPPELEQLADRIGHCIEYWGFKQIYGRIWCHMYLAGGAVDAGWLTARLGISKALVSISLRDLLAFGAIHQTGMSAKGTRMYQAVTNLSRIILGVLKSRERPMLAGIQSAASILAQRPEDEQRSAWIDPRRSARIAQLAAVLGDLLDKAQDLGELDARLLEQFDQP